MRLISDALDLGDADEARVDGICGIYRLSENTLCVEHYANKIVDGKVQKVVVLRNMWDRSCWLAVQQQIVRMFAEVSAMPNSPAEEETSVHIH
jgi:hypothetical protein